ncbi:MAG: hypothetical protein FWF52_03690 [Candidatus Azobacteroides sp.]|nr:hypothetical protein [Candidatus Azobacteroides sp.]
MSSDVPLTVEYNHIQNQYEEKVLRVTSSFTNIFYYNMLEGSVDALQQQGNIIIPQSLAQKFF